MLWLDDPVVRNRLMGAMDKTSNPMEAKEALRREIKKIQADQKILAAIEPIQQCRDVVALLKAKRFKGRKQ